GPRQATPGLESARSDEPTRYMDSAERRTEEAGTPGEAPEPDSTLSDEDIFFPRDEPVAVPATGNAAEPPPLDRAARTPEQKQSAFAAVPEEETEWHFSREQPAARPDLDEREEVQTVADEESPFRQEFFPEEEDPFEGAEREASEGPSDN